MGLMAGQNKSDTSEINNIDLSQSTDLNKNVSMSTNPSDQTEIIGAPTDFSFCDIQNLTDLIKLKPNSGKRKPIPDENKKTTVQTTQAVKSSVKV